LAVTDKPLFDRATSLGQELLRSGKVAAFTVAGGQGTRLGFDGPKGAVPITPIMQKTFFQLFAEMILAVRNRFGVAIPWYIMTSDANHLQTVDFFRQHQHFKLPASDVVFFAQSMLPSFDPQGKLLLAEKHRLALSPDGHGGSLKALYDNGALADMHQRGIQVLSYFQIDNPLVRPFDELFLGLHAATQSEMSTKATAKTDDLERVGNMCVHAGKQLVVEYSDFPAELATAKYPDGTRKFNLGNLAIHAINVDFVARIVGDKHDLPYHRADKAVGFVDAQGEKQSPKQPNAVKLEKFIFDALPLAKNALLLEIDRHDEFAPVKNASGNDSPLTSMAAQINRDVRWLEMHGVKIPRADDGHPNAVVEIAPEFLTKSDSELAKLLPNSVKPGQSLYLS
jgi:UDP-N-acetylglucosamine/UDP-N-acetylgalactosamine diphosphorylase